MTSEHYRRLSEFGEFLRKAFGGIREESRIHRHLVSCDLNELWSWACPRTSGGAVRPAADRGQEMKDRPVPPMRSYVDGWRPAWWIGAAILVVSFLGLLCLVMSDAR
jgi:hypothetical protein